MSWFARTIANTLNLEEEEQDINETSIKNDTGGRKNDDSSPLSPSRGVKEDLSELTKTVTRQLWGVASFLAPPPSSSDSNPSTAPYESDPAGIPGIRSDFVEIGGRFKSGISKLSNNMSVVSEITSKMASDFLQLGSDEEEKGTYDSSASGAAVGVTDDVVTFVRDIAMHPGTWLDFPVIENEDNEDFDMSDSQQEHALAVERLVPWLAALRMELCPGYMSEACFWKIYFILLHPRLDQHDAEVLSTPQIMEARTLLTHNKNRTEANPEQDWSRKGTFYSNDITNLQDKEYVSVPSITQSESVPIETSPLESVTSPLAAVFETEKHPVLGGDIQIIDKSVIEEGNVNQNIDQNVYSSSSSNVIEKNNEDDADDWLKEEGSEIVGSTGNTIPIDNDEDVSFSDLEEDEGDVPTGYKKVTYYSDSSTKDSRDWIQLSTSSTNSAKDINSVTVECAGSKQVSTHNHESKESNDWLDVDDIDAA